MQAGGQLMGAVDTAIVGRLGARELGAVGVANALYFSITVFGIGVMMGMDPLVSQAVGAGDHRRARHLLWQGLWLGILVSAALCLPIAVAPAVLDLMRIDAATARMARAYMLWRLPGLVPFLLYVAIRSYLQSIGRTAPMVTAMVVANVVNLGVTLLLVFGGAGLPEWAGPLRLAPGLGVSGAAIATSICAVSLLLVVAVSVARVARVPHVKRRLDVTELRRALQVGVPTGLYLAAEVTIFALVSLLAGRLGTVPLAAHQVAITLASMTFTITFGIGAAGSVRVGQSIGARDSAGTRRAGLLAFALGALFMGIAAMAFVLFGRPLSRLLTDQTEVIALSVPLLVVAAFFQVSDGVQAVGASVLRGAGDTRFALAANVVGHWLVGLPAAALLAFGAGMGVTGLWWGLSIGLTVVAVGLFLRFLRLSRRPIAPLVSSGAAVTSVAGSH